MEIGSVYNSGLTGLQNATSELRDSSSSIAQKNVTREHTEIEAVAQKTERSAESLTTELVNVKVAEYQAKASAKVITTADDALGTLIDITL